MTPAQQRPDRHFASVDALRTLGFLLVFLFHLGGTFGSRFPDHSLPRALCDSFGPWGSVGTNTFFVLSAFFLYRSLQSGSPWTQAVGRRMARIYPGFVLMLAVYLLLAPLSPSGTRFPAHPLEAFLYILANFLLLPGLIPIAPIMTVTWSLSYIVFSYLAIPALYHMLGMPRLGRRVRVAIWSGLAMVIAMASGLGWTGHGRMMYFVVGILTAEAAAITRPMGRWGWAIMCLGLSLVAASRPAAASLPLNGFALMAVVWGSLSCVKLDAILDAAPFRTLVELAYPFFLVHGLAIQFLRELWPLELTDTADLVVLMSVAVALSLVLASAMNAVLIRPLRYARPPKVRSAAGAVLRPRPV